MKKIGFVIPWYGEKIGGGAEAELRGVVHHLKDAGVEVEVLTTCVECFASDWNRNFHKPGVTEEAGIPVRRFRVRKRDTAAFDRVNGKLMAGERLTPEEEKTFCKEMVNSKRLYSFLRRYGKDYGLFVFIPYMFGTTYYGCRVWPEKSILIPCLHDESYAYMECFREAFSKVRGMIFNAEPERLLAEKLYGVKGGNLHDVRHRDGNRLAGGRGAIPQEIRDRSAVHPVRRAEGYREAGGPADPVLYGIPGEEPGDGAEVGAHRRREG